MARRRRRGLWLRVATALLLVALGIGGVASWWLYQAYQEQQKTNVALEKTNQHLEETVQEAKTQTRLANKYLAETAEALVEKGSILFAQRNLRASYIFGAKALILDPTSARTRSLAYLSVMSASYVSKKTLVGHEGVAQSVAFSPDGHTLAAAAGDTIRLWGLPEGRLLAALTDHKGPVWSVAFSPDGHTLASAAWDRTVRLWPQMAFFSLSPEHLYRQAQLDTNTRVEGLAAQTLTIEERQILKQQTAD